LLKNAGTPGLRIYPAEHLIANPSQDRDFRSEFMASISHELRTPLHTIIGFSELLAEEREGPLNEKQKRFLHHIRSDSEHLLGLINDLLDIVKIEGGRGDVFVESVPVRTAIDDAVVAISSLAAEKTVNVHGDCDPALVARADPARLRQILGNLLGNGVKFTPPGGEVSVSAVAEDGMVRITVSDTGIGIATEEQERIFEKFYQAGFTTAGVREGTGVGLTISRQLVELQGGRIWVESSPGCGSQFHFTLPV
jgi:signal transduction histidine kinase